MSTGKQVILGILIAILLGVLIEIVRKGALNDVLDDKSGVMDTEHPVDVYGRPMVNIYVFYHREHEYIGNSDYFIHSNSCYSHPKP